MLAKITLVAATSVLLSHAADEADRVTSLPDLGPLTSKHYSGYLVLDGSNASNRLGQFPGASQKTFHIHYHYIEALNDPSTAPLVLWLNGGPGCSSSFGQWTELGPYMFTQFGHISNNTYTWAQSANLLFLESPVGVGFSYASPNGNAGLTMNDDITSMLNYQSLRHFFIKFPELAQYQQRRMLLTGESYAGHYIPTLADRVLEYAIKKPASTVEERMGQMMMGFAVGNPCTGAPAKNPSGDPDIDFCTVDPDWTLQEFYRGHAFGGAFNHPNYPDPGQEYGDAYDPYDILAPICNLGGGPFEKMVREHVPHLTVDKVKKLARFSAIREVKDLPDGSAMGAIRPYGPCASNFLTVYLNRMDVKKLLHVNTDIDWAGCSYLNYQWPTTSQGNNAGVMQYYRKFFSEPQLKWHITMYSGTSDTIVNFVQSQTIVENMAGSTSGLMKPWFHRDPYNSSAVQMGGWYLDFEFMQWVSVKGCGHMVPGYCPYQAYGLFESIINTGKAGMKPRTFESSTLAPGLIPSNQCPGK